MFSFSSNKISFALPDKGVVVIKVWAQIKFPWISNLEINSFPPAEVQFNIDCPAPGSKSTDW